MLSARFRMAVLAVALLAAAVDLRAQGVVVIGHANLRKLDANTVARIYMGRVIEVDGIPVTAINAVAGSDVRIRFLRSFLNQDEEKYIAYWTVRRYIGKGAWPREIAKSADLIRYVTSTPGAIGYIDAADVEPGMNVLLR